jgi:hypothetical protein
MKNLAELAIQFVFFREREGLGVDLSMCVSMKQILSELIKHLFCETSVAEITQWDATNKTARLFVLVRMPIW